MTLFNNLISYSHNDKDMKTFTNQVYIDEKFEVVRCPVCKGLVGMRTGYPHLNADIGWFDPYRTKMGKYVHKMCLSKKRKNELISMGEVIKGNNQ